MAGADPKLGIFGIRHHGPGSAQSLVAALDDLDPAMVLIEGPPEADDLIRFVGTGQLRPPVALLVHAESDPSLAAFYPFATYSPEWQAMTWALARSRPVRFIDLPAMHGLAQRAEAKAVTEELLGAAPLTDEPTETDPSLEPEATSEPDEPAATSPTEPSIRRDPMGYLAQIAGYADGEAWWNA